MNVQDAVRQQLSFWHATLSQVIADCDDDALHRSIPHATITSIASIYAHVAFVEDAIVHPLLQGQPLLFDAHRREHKESVEFPGMPPAITADWARSVRMDRSSFQKYAASVFSATDSYLEGLSDAELDRKVSGAFGEQTVAWVVVNILGTHAPQHAGEIAAVKGVLGLKGLPF